MASAPRRDSKLRQHPGVGTVALGDSQHPRSGGLWPWGTSLSKEPQSAREQLACPGSRGQGSKMAWPVPRSHLPEPQGAAEPGWCFHHQVLDTSRERGQL